jgi:hypothetical protein
MEKPFQFFIDLIYHNRIAEYKNKFSEIREEYKMFITLEDKENEVVKYTGSFIQDEVCYENVECSYDVKKELNTKLEEEYKRITKELNSVLFHKALSNEKHTYILNVCNQVDILLDELVKTALSVPYPMIAEKLNQIKEFLKESVNTPKEGNKATKNVKAEKKIKRFKWLNNFNENMLLLYSSLESEKLIQTDFNTFCKAFDNTDINSPLNIKWLVIGKNKDKDKSSLFYLIEQLEEKKFIEEDLSPNHGLLYKRIRKTFVDKDGNPFQNLPESKKQAEKSRPEKGDIIDSIIKKLPK